MIMTRGPSKNVATHVKYDDNLPRGKKFSREEIFADFIVAILPLIHENKFREIQKTSRKYIMQKFKKTIALPGKVAFNEKFTKINSANFRII